MASHILTADEVRQLGGTENLEAFRRALHKQPWPVICPNCGARLRHGVCSRCAA